MNCKILILAIFTGFSLTEACHHILKNKAPLAITNLPLVVQRVIASYCDEYVFSKKIALSTFAQDIGISPDGNYIASFSERYQESPTPKKIISICKKIKTYFRAALSGDIKDDNLVSVDSLSAIQKKELIAELLTLFTYITNQIAQHLQIFITDIKTMQHMQCTFMEIWKSYQDAKINVIINRALKSSKRKINQTINELEVSRKQFNEQLGVVEPLLRKSDVFQALIQISEIVDLLVEVPIKEVLGQFYIQYGTAAKMTLTWVDMALTQGDCPCCSGIYMIPNRMRHIKELLQLLKQLCKTPALLECDFTDFRVCHHFSTSADQQTCAISLQNSEAREVLKRDPAMRSGIAEFIKLSSNYWLTLLSDKIENTKSNQIAIYNTAEGLQKNIFDVGNSRINAIALSKNGKYVAAGTAHNATVYLYNTHINELKKIELYKDPNLLAKEKTLTKLPEQMHQRTITSLTFSPNNTYLIVQYVSSIMGRSIFISSFWHVESGGCDYLAPEKVPYGNSIAFSENGSYLATLSNDQEISIFENRAAQITESKEVIKHVSLNELTERKLLKKIIPKNEPLPKPAFISTANRNCLNNNVVQFALNNPLAPSLSERMRRSLLLFTTKLHTDQLYKTVIAATALTLALNIYFWR